MAPFIKVMTSSLSLDTPAKAAIFQSYLLREARVIAATALKRWQIRQMGAGAGGAGGGPKRKVIDLTGGGDNDDRDDDGAAPDGRGRKQRKVIDLTGDDASDDETANADDEHFRRRLVSAILSSSSM